jgi:hypothetical protein
MVLGPDGPEVGAREGEPGALLKPEPEPEPETIMGCQCGPGGGAPTDVVCPAVRKYTFSSHLQDTQSGSIAAMAEVAMTLSIPLIG